MASCFISHATSDRAFVECEIVGLLRALGVTPWFAEDDIKSAEDWERSILSGLETSDWFIVLISSASVSSERVKDEVAWAIRKKPGRIIPILIADCDPEHINIRLPNIQHIDFRTQPNEARQKLITLFVDIEYNPIRRASAIMGDWYGTITQDPGSVYPEGVTYPIEAKLVIKRRSIEGVFEIGIPYKDETVRIEFSVSGGLQYERFVQLNYSSRDRGTIQFGSVIMQLSSYGLEMEGRFVGYGALSEEIVTGRVDLEKAK